MEKLAKKLLSICTIFAIVLSSVPVAFAGGADVNMQINENLELSDNSLATSEDYFIALDEEGNVTHIPLSELEVTDYEALRIVEQAEYSVSVEVAGTEKVLNSSDSLVEAQNYAMEFSSMQMDASFYSVALDLPEELFISEAGDSQASTEVSPETAPEASSEAELENTETSSEAELEDTETSSEAELEDTETSSEAELEDTETSSEAEQEETQTNSQAEVSVQSEENSNNIPVSNEIYSIESIVESLEITKTIPEDIEHGVIIFNNYKNEIVLYTNAITGEGGYTNGAFAPDAAYLGLAPDGRVKFLQSGVTGLVSPDEVLVIEYDDFVAQNKVTSVYTTSQGRLYHKITVNNQYYASTQLVGYQQDYMSSNATYFSYDGIYFYTNYKTMVDDYEAGNRNNSINKNEPYYNYYQYLSHRTATGYSAEEIDTFIYESTKNHSKPSVMLGMGNAFIDAQNSFGVNALLMLGVAINESAWGSSAISQDKNNLFGHGAVDSNPYYGSNKYDSPAHSIMYHADIYISELYAHPYDWRYNGSHLGNKESGANVRYASDPYWGEKAASQVYYFDRYFDNVPDDYNSVSYGVSSVTVDVYKEPTTDSRIEPLYNTNSGYGKVVSNVPVVILSEHMHEGEKWYKVQSDATLSPDRGEVVENVGEYDFSKDYGYVKAALINVVNIADDLESYEPKISYSTHIQYLGWSDWVSNGESSGTVGSSLRLEGIEIELKNMPESGSVEYRTHIQNVGWESVWKKDGAMSGTSGQSLRLEAIQIKLTGEIANVYDVYYRVHCQNLGWLDWAKNGQEAGSAGMGYRLEAIEIVLVEKNGTPPGSTTRPFYTEELSVSYSSHVQDIGWQEYKLDGESSGTSGKSLRLEGMKIMLQDSSHSGSIEYRTHIQNIGWETSWKKDGQVSGTSGQSLRLEAIEIKLTGEVSELFDIYYRVHAQNYGWLDWASNGAPAGTSGQSLRLEAIQIVTLPKGTDPNVALGSTDTPYVAK